MAKSVQFPKRDATRENSPHPTLSFFGQPIYHHAASPASTAKLPLCTRGSECTEHHMPGVIHRFTGVMLLLSVVRATTLPGCHSGSQPPIFTCLFILLAGVFAVYFAPRGVPVATWD